MGSHFDVPVPLGRRDRMETRLWWVWGMAHPPPRFAMSFDFTLWACDGGFLILILLLIWS
ncbi:hypothetical protein BJY00DRAFT_289922 [Aspergillus carlsbadensis]|nr:hypothetical protein BJY00DRAFT_289922 [Aspergillus carlsbadensis]